MVWILGTKEIKMQDKQIKIAVYELKCTTCIQEFNVRLIEKITERIYCPYCGTKNKIEWEYAREITNK